MVDLAAAKAEISRLRGLAEDHFSNSGEDLARTETAAKKTFAKGAVNYHGRAEVCDILDVASLAEDYKKKCIDKPDIIASVLRAVLDSNVLFKSCKREEKENGRERNARHGGRHG